MGCLAQAGRGLGGARALGLGLCMGLAGLVCCAAAAGVLAAQVLVSALVQGAATAGWLAPAFDIVIAPGACGAVGWRWNVTLDLLSRIKDRHGWFGPG